MLHIDVDPRTASAATITCDAATTKNVRKKVAAKRKRLYPEDDDVVPKQAARKRRKRILYALRVKSEDETVQQQGIPNKVIQGGVCRRHGAKICSEVECTNQAQIVGVCRKHWAKKL
jgi:hypothetical protein